MEKIHVLGFVGSLRERSHNRALLAAAEEYLPEGMTLETFDIADIPLYNNDVYEAGLPEAVQRFRERIANADALLIATPEYNHSVPGVLKNALDWASRPPDQPFNGKPVAIMGASSGLGGTLRAQMHLRNILASLNTHPVNRPQVTVRQAADKFDKHGRLTDEQTVEHLRALLTALGDWARRLK